MILSSCFPSFARWAVAVVLNLSPCALLGLEPGLSVQDGNCHSQRRALIGHSLVHRLFCAPSWLCALLLVVCVPIISSSSAKAGNLPLAEQYAIRQWDTEDGLPEGGITGIEQLPDGFLWLTTRHNLVRFDGVRFVSVDEKEWPQGHPSVFRGLHLNHQGELLVYGEGGVMRSNNNRWSMLQPDHAPAPKLIQWVGEAPDGVCWAVSDTGIYRVEGTRLIAVPLRPAPSNIIDAAMDRRGTIYLLSPDALFQFRDGKCEVLPQPANSPKNSRVFVGPDDNVWIYAFPWVFCLEDGQWKQQNPVRITSVSVFENATWVGSADGLFRWQGNSREQLTGNDAPTDVQCLRATPDGILWVGTSKGISRIRPRTVRMFGTTSDEQRNRITALLPMAPDAFWCGSAGNNGLQAGIPGKMVGDLFGKHEVSALLLGRDGILWIGTPLFHLWSRNALGVTRQYAFLGGLGSLDRSRYITALLEDSSGCIWVGTREGVAFLAPNKALISVPGISETIFALAEDADKQLWAGTQGNGVCRISKNGTTQVFRKADGLPSDMVRLIVPEADGGLWLGTPAGLGYWVTPGRRDASPFCFTQEHGLPDNDIRQILDDTVGNLWIGTRIGILKVAKSELAQVAAGRKQTLSFQTFGRDEGLEAPLTRSEGGPLSARLPEGTLWFATQAGLARIDPQELHIPTADPLPIIEEMRVAGQKVTSKTRGGKLAIGPGAREVEFSFTSPDYSAPERVLFITRLEGLEQAWSKPRIDRAAHYPHLSAGDYKFRVMTGTAEGGWREAGGGLAFVVLPYFWQTFWFSGACLALTAALAGFGSAWLVRRHARKKIERAERAGSIEKERARIARDLHDEIGAKLTRISFLSTMVAEDVHAPQNAHDQAAELAVAAMETHRAFDEIVWSVNPRNDTVKELAHGICRYAEEFLARSPIKIRISMQPNLPEIAMEPSTRHSLFLATKEAISNAFKHSGAEQLHLSISFAGGVLEILVSDNGKGFDPSLPSHRNGLKGMNERLIQIGGACSITCPPSHGTSVQFRFPIAP